MDQLIFSYEKRATLSAHAAELLSDSETTTFHTPKYENNPSWLTK